MTEDTPQHLPRIQKLAEEILKTTKGVDEHTGDIGRKLYSIVTQVGFWFSGTANIKEAMLKLLPHGESLTKIFAGQAQSVGQIEDSLFDLRSQLLELNTGVLQQFSIIGRRGKEILLDITDQNRPEFILHKEKEIRALEQQEKLYKLIHDYSLTIGVLGSSLLTVYRNSYKSNAEINAELIKANSTSSERLSLVSNIYDVQKLTGISLQTTIEAAKALLQIGFRTGIEFETTLKAVSEMKEGLGVSVETGAELARIYQTGLNIPLEKVGNSLANIVNQTALAGDEAGKFALEIGKAALLLGKTGKELNVTELSEFSSKFASELYKVGGNKEHFIKAFSEMISGATPEGFMLRTRLGHPFSAPKNEREAMLDIQRLNTLINQIVPEGGQMRPIRLETAATMFPSLGKENISQWAEALKGLEHPVADAISLTDRYNEQVRNSGKSLGQAWTEIMTLAEKGAMPMIEFVKDFAEDIAKVAKWLAKLPDPLVQITLVLGTAGLGGALWKIGRQLKETIGNFELLAISLKQLQNNAALLTPRLGAVAAVAGISPATAATGGALAGAATGGALAGMLARQTASLASIGGGLLKLAGGIGIAFTVFEITKSIGKSTGELLGKWYDAWTHRYAENVDNQILAHKYMRETKEYLQYATLHQQNPELTAAKFKENLDKIIKLGIPAEDLTSFYASVNEDQAKLIEAMNQPGRKTVEGKLYTDVMKEQKELLSLIHYCMQDLLETGKKHTKASEEAAEQLKKTKAAHDEALRIWNLRHTHMPMPASP